MEVSHGFIVGIFNYCDSWCATCPFTSRCRLFAHIAEIETALDPGLRAIVDAPPLPQDVPPPPPAWMRELIDDMNEAAREPLPQAEIDRLRPKISPEHEPLRMCAEGYGERLYSWRREHEAFVVTDPDDPRAIVEWFHWLIAVKIVRALHGLADDDPDERDWPADYDGSAKVALVGIERSHAAWLQIVERGLATSMDAEPFVRELVWLGEELERVFPKARAFVRPAFDEPHEVARLRASEGV